MQRGRGPSVGLIVALAWAAAESYAGEPESRVLDAAEVATKIPERDRAGLGIDFPIRKAYAYADRTGDYLLAITEHVGKKAEPEPVSDKIRACLLKREGAGLRRVWMIQDVLNRQNDVIDEERSIWFWTKYLSLTDVDGDGQIDPVMVYGTDEDGSGTDNGRLYIVVVHRGRKHKIRHQNGTLDPQRHTEIEPSFYRLPAPLIRHVRSLMARLTQDGHCIFPAGWQAKMNKRRTYIEE